MISVDGYTAGPDQAANRPFGKQVEHFHDWILKLQTFRELVLHQEGGETGPSNDVIRETAENLGATIMGRHMFGPDRGDWDLSWRGWWGENPPYHTPVFVLAHRPRESLAMEGGNVFHFVTDGIEAALSRAKEVAGDKDVRIGGGANTVNQYLAAGLVDELELHVVPVLIGAGERLFGGLGENRPKLELIRTVAAPDVTHVKYRIVK
jgi:dihydrofolate reductase